MCVPQEKAVQGPWPSAREAVPKDQRGSGRSGALPLPPIKLAKGGKGYYRYVLSLPFASSGLDSLPSTFGFWI